MVFIFELLSFEDVYYGFFFNNNLIVFFVMSDGVVFKFMFNDGWWVAFKLFKLVEVLCNNEFKCYDLIKLFYLEFFLEGYDGDDCSIVLIVC